MIVLYRFFVLVLTAFYASAFTATFVYHVRLLGEGKIWVFDMALYIEALLWSGLGIIGLLLIAGSALAAGFVGLFFPVRRLSLKEEKRAFPCLERVKVLYKERYGRDIKTRLMAVDVPGIEGMAIGGRIIALSTGLLKVGTDEEIAAGIAHEIAHLHYKDSLFYVLLRAATLPIFVLIFPFFMFSGNNEEKRRTSAEAESSGIGSNIGLIVFIALVCFLPLFVLAIISAFFVVHMSFLARITDWPVEYRADRFAMSLGLGEALISLLENFEDEDIRNKDGFLQNYAYSHPPIALRIDQVERALLKAVDGA